MLIEARDYIRISKKGTKKEIAQVSYFVRLLYV